MPICGPKLSVCGMILGIWGVIMLFLMGVFLRVHAATFAEDLPIDENEWVKKNLSMTYVYEKYNQAAYNCFVAAAVYVAVMLFSFLQYKLNMKSNYQTS